MTFPSLSTNPLSALLPFKLKELPGFPHKEYLAQLEAYTLLESWYDGSQLSATVVDEASGQSVEKYPIKINPIKQTAQKHVGVLFGQNVDSIKMGGIPVQFIPETDDLSVDEAAKMKKALTRMYEDSHCGGMFYANGLISQHQGGCVFAANWHPETKTIEITNPEPKEFIGIPDGKNYWNLREGWIVRAISETEAKSYGYVPKMGESDFFYIEYWTRTTYKIMVNGKVITIGDTDQKAEGDNPFGVVPIVYIPHIRERGFLGIPIITESTKGLVREMNLRWADVGDGVSEDSHQLIAMRNMRGSPKTIDVNGRNVVDLGSVMGLTPNESAPDLIALKTQSVSEPMLKFGAELEVLYRREMNHPAVADGEDEGSQRSSLTLTTRMWPLVAEAEFERVWWTIGLTVFSRILMKMAIEKGVYGITQKMLEASFVVQWLPMLPRDREALVQEAVMRSTSNLASQTHLMQLFGDIQDPEAELAKIIEQNEKVSKSEQPPIAQPGFGGSSNQGAKNTPGANIAKEK